MPLNPNCNHDPICDGPKHKKGTPHISRTGTPVRTMQTGQPYGGLGRFSRKPSIFVECCAFHDYPKGSPEHEQRCLATGYFWEDVGDDKKVRRIFEAAGWRIYSGPGTTTRCDAHANVPTYEDHQARHAAIEPAVF